MRTWIVGCSTVCRLPFAMYASRRQLRAWPGGGGGGARSLKEIFLSTPLAACPEGLAEGRSAGLGVCFRRLSTPTSSLVRRGLRLGAQLEEEFALYASHRRLRARP